MTGEQKKVLVFGTFDNLHHGHTFFLSEAKKLGDLYVSVASNESVAQRKKRDPKQDILERIEGVRKTGLAQDVLPGDKTLNEWTALKIVQPNIIAVGFDQFGLKTALQDIQNKYGFEIVKISKFDEDSNLEL
ncbi:MAG: adenylyltransferase/cytidyltransferase family protein [Candidatus Paceibacterota bacterium]|jgi:cytidyltransferase-like protein